MSPGAISYSHHNSVALPAPSALESVLLGRLVVEVLDESSVLFVFQSQRSRI